MAQYSFTQDGQVIHNSAPVMTFYLGLTPVLVLQKYFIWQFFSYMFLHGGFFHIFLNMYALLIFGIPIEQAWGSRKFLFYYLFTGTGAGLTIFLINLAIGGSAFFVPTIGASGAVFGLLLAFGILYPNAEILLFFFLPIKAKYLVVLYGGIELYSLISTGGQGNISHVGHLGGIIFGLIFFFITQKRSFKFKTKIIKARVQRDISAKKTSPEKKSDNITFLNALLVKVRQSGTDAISDDEMQHFKYLEIMTEDPGDLCVESDFNNDDAFCKKCPNIEVCLIREIKRHL
ncbi:MAG TPA: rhomboid family intramembrane serine protease [Spirochaetota bacterium]|nr:rhomboid family intramembrane serine protease [Spirochaetota bacterium]HPI89056.1 rhomboid family intramembrane serine protease [Spirochaetota bacterium]HPR48733.1 rhomboid family intramembrane serine protease [Spirochaetota bacterium]